MTSPQRLVHLVRHGEVHNPDHLVYADLPGFGLSELGRRQAFQAAVHLATRTVGIVVSSPLQRAIETAGFIAARHGIGVTVDDRLTEWTLARRWAGVRWEDMSVERPAELEAYLADPSHLPFSPESLTELGRRVADAARDHAAATRADVVILSHQDPIHAGFRTLTAAGFEEFNVAKPAHATVVSLRPDAEPWLRAGRFDPDQGESFPPATTQPNTRSETG